MMILSEKRELQSEFFPSKIGIVMRVGAKTEALPRFRMKPVSSASSNKCFDSNISSALFQGVV